MRTKAYLWPAALAALIFMLAFLSADMSASPPASRAAPLSGDSASDAAYLQAAATITPSPSPSPSLQKTPPSLAPDPVRERRPSLLVGAALIVGVILIGLALQARRA